MRGLAPLLVALATGIGLQSHGGAQAPSAADLARRIQTHYNSVADFTADFTVSYRYELQPQTSVERGDLKVKKPNRMRWTYRTPTRKEFVADGARYYAHFPEDKWGLTNPLPEAGDAPLALLFLAGKGDLTRDFEASLPPEQPPGEWRLRLTPRTRQDDYTWLVLAVRRDTLALTGMAIADDLGTQTFQFTRFQTNRGLRDTEFVFRFPKGTEIR